jgi:predicted permease
MIPGLHEFFERARSLFRKRRLHDEMGEELDFHQSLLREKLLRQGVPQLQIDATLRRTFGNPARWQERLRELWQFRNIENLARDVRFSFRLLRKSPGFTAVALITLALGVGANTSVFSLINALLFRPLAVPHADQLAVLSFTQGAADPQYDFCTPFFRSLESRRNLFANVFAYVGENMQVKGPAGNENVRGQLVSGQFFAALQTPPLLGRYLTPEDDRRGGNPTGYAAVISEGFWNTWFQRTPDVIGRKLIIANTPFIVAGVMPQKFAGADPTERPQIFAPLSADPIIDAPHNHIDDGMHAWWITVIARLNPADTLQHANAALLAVSKPILEETSDSPEDLRETEKEHFHFAAESGSRGFTYARFIFRKPLIAMFAMCGGILVLACVNLASLLMARSAARERELAARLAIGATRMRLVQQLLVESALIAILGTLAGLATVPLINHALTLLQISDHNGNENVQLNASPDLRLFAFTALIAVVTTMLIGLLPALQATSGDLNQQIKSGQHVARPWSAGKLLPRVLMSFEVALALVLVVGAGLLATSLVRLFHSGLGFDPQGLVNISFRMDKQPLTCDALMRVYQQIGEGISHQPGVESSSFEFIVPVSGLGWNARYVAPGSKPESLMMNAVGPQYFQTMHIPMFQGREFTWSDTKASGMKIILNQSAAKLLYPGQNPIGQQVIEGHDKIPYEVVAVVGDTKYRDMRRPSPPAAYVPLMQSDEEKPSFSAVVRVSGPPLVAAARTLATRFAPTIPAPLMTSVDDVIANSLFAERMMAWLSVFFAGCALLVTAIGLYGTLAYSTARRTSEIGIRIALGAQRGGVVAMVFRENAIVALAGCAAGFIAAIAASSALASFLYETSPHDPWILIGSVAALSVIASAASLLPAIRAARIEPIVAIRCE